MPSQRMSRRGYLAILIAAGCGAVGLAAATSAPAVVSQLSGKQAKPTLQICALGRG